MKTILLLIFLQSYVFPIYPVENKCPIDHPNKVTVQGAISTCPAVACIKLYCGNDNKCNYLSCSNQCAPYSYDLCLTDEELKNAKE